jgi:probable phosphoglycerate mutase
VTAHRLLLWRHGRTAYNQQDRFQGHTDVPLDGVGLAQARVAARALAAMVTGHGPLRVVASDLRRAAQTAAELSRVLGLGVEEDPSLREVDAGEWEGLTRPEIAEHWAADLDAWHRGEDVRVGGAERRSDASRRTFSSIVRRSAEQDGGTLVVVSHGAVLRGATTMLLELPATAGRSFAVLSNAHWVELVRAPWAGSDGAATGWRLVAYNVGAPGAPADGEPADTSDAAADAIADPAELATITPGAPGADLEAARPAGVDSPSRQEGFH